MRQLIRHIEDYKRLKNDRLQGKGKAPLVNCPQQDGLQPRPRKDLRVQEPEVQIGEVNVMFKEPMHKIIDRIKNESYFRWPNKMRGDPTRRNQNLYCMYHRDKGHTIELVKARYLKEFVMDSGNRGTR